MNYPEKIRAVEIGPRDGFQNIKEFIPTEVKIRIIEALIAAGSKEMEITSFVHPKAIPQMADAAEVASCITQKYRSGFTPAALVPNAKGAENALKSGVNVVTYVISVSEKHNMANVNRMPEESLEDLENMVRAYPELRVKLAVATAFGCPFLGKIPEEEVVEFVKKGLDTGVAEITLCDTIGAGNPKQADSLLKKIIPVTGPERLGVHFHDTRGMGLANTFVALSSGVETYETSVGGLGGCPFAPGAAGNTASEDMINMFHEMGVETGIDLDCFLAAANIVRENISEPLTGHLINVCKR